MFENYQQMSAEEKARTKAIYQAIRADFSEGDRYRNLAWGYIRGFKFRRIERQHKVQQLGPDAYCPVSLGFSKTPEGKFFEHNMPCAARLTTLIAKHLPEFESDLKNKWQVKSESRILAWLADPSGAIPVPVRQPRAPFVRPTTQGAA